MSPCIIPGAMALVGLHRPEERRLARSLFKCIVSLGAITNTQRWRKCREAVPRRAGYLIAACSLQSGGPSRVLHHDLATNSVLSLNNLSQKSRPPEHWRPTKVENNFMARPLMIAVCVATLLGHAVSQQPAPKPTVEERAGHEVSRTPVNSLVQLNNSLKELVRKVSPAVV